MSNQYGNLAWRKLSPTRTRDGRPVPSLTEAEYADLWETLSVEQQQLVARGDLSLEGLLDALTSARGAELCPVCCTRPIQIVKTGLCRPCHRAALTDAQNAILAEIFEERRAATVKQQLHRAREAAGIPLPRSRRSAPADQDDQQPEHEARAQERGTHRD